MYASHNSIRISLDAFGSGGGDCVALLSRVFPTNDSPIHAQTAQRQSAEEKHTHTRKAQRVHQPARESNTNDNK